MRPTSFRKSPRFQGLSPGCHFGTPWLILASIFACLGALSGLIMVAGDAVFASLYQIGYIFGLPCSLSLQFTLHFNPVVHRNARTCSSSLKSLVSPTEFCRRSVLSVTKHYFHVYTGQRRGRRDSRSANNSLAAVKWP